MIAPSDPRRTKRIRVNFRPGRSYTAPVYTLKVEGQLWAAVEWSETRQRWCIEDSAGACLLHVEHQHGEDPDPKIALELAKAMIRDGRMPSPEEANQQLEKRKAERAETVAALDDGSLPEAVADFCEMFRENEDLSRSNSFQRLRAELERQLRALIERDTSRLHHARWSEGQHAYRATRAAAWTKFVEEERANIAKLESEIQRWNHLLDNLRGAR